MNVVFKNNMQLKQSGSQKESLETELMKWE